MSATPEASVPENVLEGYTSVFSDRYGTPEMRDIWGRGNTASLARRMWVGLAEAQYEAGLVTAEELADLRAHEHDPIDVEEIRLREMDPAHPKYTGHDVLAAISEFKERVPVGGRVIHRGATSEDILSNVEVTQIQESIGLVRHGLVGVLGSFANKIEEHAEKSTMGYTHLQAGEPTTVGYRLARYGQNFLLDLETLDFFRSQLKGKGFKGAVGTSASYDALLEGSGISPQDQERIIMERLGITPVLISGQTYPRKFVLMTMMTLAGLAATSANFASDVKILQSTPFDEMAEPRNKRDKGSSAMPHKQNPRHVENIISLARGLQGGVIEAWQTTAGETLERGLEDSAGKRSYLPEGFLAITEILKRTGNVIEGIQVRDVSIDRNMRNFGAFSATEPLLMAASRAGADRQVIYDRLAFLAGEAYTVVRNGEKNPLRDLILNDSLIAEYVDPQTIDQAFNDVSHHTGIAPDSAREMARIIRERIAS